MNSKPKCVIVTGRPGSGKTTLSKKLGQQLWMPVISRDEIKEGYVNTFGVKHNKLSPDTNGIVSNFFFDVIGYYLINKISIVIEAAFQHEVWETRMSTILESSHPYIIVCSIDSDLAAKRHLHRGLDNPNREFYHGDKRVSIYRDTGEMAPPNRYVAPNFNVPTLHVLTENDYSPSIDEISRRIQSEDA